MNQELNAYSFLALGYRDYIAARFLLNNNYILQGLTLSSSAVEKYFKAILFARGKTKKDIGVHMDKLEKLRMQLDECYYDITKKIDTRFLDILGKAYQIRYYDEIRTPITIGFFINQFIGELDYVIHFIETKVITSIKDTQGNTLQSPYQKALSERDRDLAENNYILNGTSKKEHMEKEDTGFAIHLKPNSLGIGEIHVVGTSIKNKYEGQIWEINIKV